MRTKDERADFMATANALVDDFLRSLNQSGRGGIENFQALARVVLWTALPNLLGETAEMKRAREMMRAGAMMFECAVSLANEADEIKWADAE